MNPFSWNGNNIAVGALTESLEDYLEIIFRLLMRGKVARVRDIAREKGVKTSSVISALQRLVKEGLVEYQVREFVDLTENGRELAFRLHQRHIFLKRFLVELLQVDEETAEKDACSMEHAISVATLDRIAALSEFLTYCPKAGKDLIATFRDCWLVQPEKNFVCDGREECGLWNRKLELADVMGIQSLVELQRGQKGYIARIMADSSVRSTLIRRGFLPSAQLEVVHVEADGTLELKVAGESRKLPPEEAKGIFVWVYSKQVNLPDGYPHPLSLSQIEPGSHFRVVKLLAQGEIRQRLLDMGFIRGVEGVMLREALLKDPIEIELKGYLLSLRRSEASDILVERVDNSLDQQPQE